jgi:hypothetical protein
MKRQYLILIALVTFTAALTTNTFGQTGKTVKAIVSFDFQIGEHNFPAGEYLIEQVSRQSDNILQVRSIGDTHTKQIIVANHSNAGRRQLPKLVFQKSGENYFLTKIYLDAEQWGYAIRPSRIQHESEKAQAIASLETVEVRLTK